MGGMKRALTNLPSWVASLAALVATVPSCGSGIHDGEGEFFAKKTVDQAGGEIEVQGAVLDICPDCLKAPTLVTLRRYLSIQHGGALSPVFELEIPTVNAFVGTPRIVITPAPAVAADPSSTIGFLVPGGKKDQWIPNQQSSDQPCSSTSICGQVQIGTFANPPLDSGLTSTTKLDFAIIKKCDVNADCPSQQFCTSGACQDCPLCNK
jgi:hypothetical protein